MAGELAGAPDWVTSYEAGLTAWRAGDFAAATGAFEKTIELRGNDAASSLMIERCQDQIANPTGEDWEGPTGAGRQKRRLQEAAPGPRQAFCRAANARRRILARSSAG